MRQVIQEKMVALGRLEFLTPEHAWTCTRTALGGASHPTLDNNHSYNIILTYKIEINIPDWGFRAIRLPDRIAATFVLRWARYASR